MDKVMDDLYVKWLPARRPLTKSLLAKIIIIWGYPPWSFVIPLFWRTPIYKETYHVCQHAQRSPVAKFIDNLDTVNVHVG